MDRKYTPAQTKLLNSIELGNKRIAEGSLICYHCRKNPANQVIILSTLNESEGAPEGSIRMLTCGICFKCDMFASEQDRQNAAHLQFLEIAPK